MRHSRCGLSSRTSVFVLFFLLAMLPMCAVKSAATEALAATPAASGAPIIAWITPTAITYGTALNSTQLKATASVPGTFVYTPAAGTVLSAGTQKLSATFTPTDRADYASVTQSVSLKVNKAEPVITWAAPASISQGAPLDSAQLNAEASVPGTFVYTPQAGAVLAKGIQPLTATFTPNDAANYTSPVSHIKSIHRVFGGMDSLTQGAGSPLDSYFKELETPLTNEAGNGNLSYQPFDLPYALLVDVGFGYSGTNPCYMQDEGSIPWKYALGGECQYVLSNKGNFWWIPAYSWKTAKIYFMWLGSSGGSWSMNNVAEGEADPLRLEVVQGASTGSCPNKDTPNVLQTCTFESDATSSGIVAGLSGSVAMFGGDFSVDGTSESTGITLTNLATGGQKMSKWAQFDHPTMQEWYAALKPDLVLMQGGMNDRTTAAPGALKSYLQDWISDVRVGSPAANIALMQSDDSVDAAATYLQSYGPMELSLASTDKTEFFSVRSLFGTYAEAAADGLMLSDGVHPDAAGDKLIATNLASYLGFTGNMKTVMLSVVAATAADSTTELQLTGITPTASRTHQAGRR